jgi:hypothetical protein
MSIGVFHKGDDVRVEADFVDINDVPVDPTTVTLKVMDPSGNIDEYTYALGGVIKASVGSYYKDVDADEEGDWHCWWVSTASGKAAEPTQFVVEPTPF